MTVQHPAPAPSPRKARPRDRRQQIIAAASELFVAEGFGRTSMNDIAEAVDIRPSALYRHFPGKRQLLHEVVSSGLDPVFDVIATLDADRSGDPLARLAAVAHDGRHPGVLWQREAKHMSPSDAQPLQARILTGRGLLVDWLRMRRPELGAAAADLVVASMIAVLVSPSFHRVDAPRPDQIALTEAILGTVADCEPFTVAPTPEAPPRVVLTPATRREALLAESTRMFADAGFEDVSIEAIAARIGIAGPSVYNHFATKTDLLGASFRRMSEVLFSDVSRAYSRGQAAEPTLRDVMQSYITFSRDHSDFIGLLIAETWNLSDEVRQDAQRAQHEYVNEWRHLLRLARPDLPLVDVRMRTNAVIDIINTTARISGLRRNPSVVEPLSRICESILWADPLARSAPPIDPARPSATWLR